MIPTITASPETLLHQACLTAAGYMSSAVEAIDSQFGQGFAKANPALVAAFMAAAGQDFHTAISVAQAQRIEGAVGAISDSLDRVARAIGEMD